MRVTIGFGGKRLFVSYANNYWFVHKTTIGLRVNEQCCTLVSSHFPPHSQGKCFVSLRDIRGEARDWSQFPRYRVFAFSSWWSSFLSYWDEEAHLSLSPPMLRKLGASYRYYKRSITPLLYSWLTVMKSICALGPFLNQYWSLSWPVLLRSPTNTGNIYRPVLVSSVTSTGCLPLLYRKDYLASRDCATLSVPLQEECPTQAP